MVLEIYENHGLYYAKIIETFIENKQAICEKCTGTKKGETLIGLVIIEGIKNQGNEYNGGSILDPESGDSYSCYLELVNKNKLKVRGYMGISLFGRTQYWERINYGTK